MQGGLKCLNRTNSSKRLQWSWRRLWAAVVVQQTHSFRQHSLSVCFEFLSKGLLLGSLTVYRSALIVSPPLRQKVDQNDPFSAHKRLLSATTRRFSALTKVSGALLAQRLPNLPLIVTNN